MKNEYQSKFKKFIYNPWTLVVGTVILGIFIPSSINAIKNQKNIVESVQMILQTIFTAIKTFLCFRIPVWAILLTLLGIVAAIIIIFKFFYNDEPLQEPLWKAFTHFQWKDWLFTWEYSGNMIINLRPICNNCKCELTYESSGHMFDRGFFYCPNCSSKYPGIYQNELKDVEKIIYHKLNNGEYKNEITIPKETKN